MSVIKTQQAYRGALDHFEPERSLDAAEQRKLRGQLEQIDYTAYAANQAVMGQALGSLDTAAMQRLAVAAATARGRWIRAALDVAAEGRAPSGEETQALSAHRAAYEELREAYEGARRMIERGYVAYTVAP